jgi:outer membrane receptor protein involved in Fe transport
LLIEKDSVVQADLSDEQGIFNIMASRGNYVLSVFYFGDTVFSQNILLNKNIDLKTIKIHPKTKELQEITVVAQKPLIERRADRLIFNAANLPTADGGNVIDILRATPSLLVNNNTISIVGKGSVNILVNERFIQLSGEELMIFLKSLRANDVEKIEVITTPPAKYSAEGNSGLVNIVLKKTAQNSWNGSVFGNYTQTKYSEGSVGSSFNYRKNRLSFYTSASYYGGKSYGEDEAVIYYPDLKWINKGNFTSISHYISFRGGFDVEVMDKWLVGAMYVGSFGNTPTSAKDDKITLFDISVDNNAGLIETHGNDNAASNIHSANLHTVYKIDTLGGKINFDFDFLDYNSNNNSKFGSSTSNSQHSEIPNNFTGQNNILDRKINNYSIQIDVEQAIKKVNLNYGVKLSFSDTDNDIKVFDLSSSIPIEISNQSNKFLYRENTQSIWISANAKFGKDKWEAQAGLRGENTQFKGNSVTMDTIFRKKYFELFPTAYLSFSPNNKNIFYLEYGRRISRPSFSQLNPFRSYSSPYYYFVGNPELQPSISNSVSLGYIFNNIFQTSLFFDYDKNNSGGGIVLIDTNTYTSYGTRLNYLNKYDFGVGVVYIFKKLNWWTSQNSVNVWYDKVFSKIYPITPKIMEGVGANFQTYNILYFNKNQTVQAGFEFSYSPPQILELSYSFQKFNLNAFVKMLFLQKKLSLTLSGNNLLKAYSFNTESQRNGILYYSKGYYEPLNIRLSISYSFGNNDINVKERSAGNEDEKNRL